MNVEIIDFYRPDASRKNLYITNIPNSLPENDLVANLHETFEPYGLVYGVQVFPSQIRLRSEAAENQSSSTGGSNSAVGGYYAFVTFYSAQAATRAKEDLNSVLLLGENECKIAFARRKKDVLEKQILYFTRCYELINYYLGFNSWSTSIKTLFEDKESVSETEQTKTVKFVCLVELSVRDLNTDGIGVWDETFLKTDPMSKIQAVCKCKKLCQQRALENAFSKVLLVVLPNGKVTVEIDTTKPDFTSSSYVPDDQLIKPLWVENAFSKVLLVVLPKGKVTLEIDTTKPDFTSSSYVPDDQLLKVNDLDVQPTSKNLPEEIDDEDLNSMSAIDDVNIHILQELEEDF